LGGKRTGPSRPCRYAVEGKGGEEVQGRTRSQRKSVATEEEGIGVAAPDRHPSGLKVEGAVGGGIIWEEGREEVRSTEGFRSAKEK